MGLSYSLISLFITCKNNLITFPLLLEYNSKTVFLKTNRSAGYIGDICIYADDYYNSLDTLKYLTLTGECIFDLSLSSSRSQHVLFGSRSNMIHDQHYYSFFSEVTCERWNIVFH